MDITPQDIAAELLALASRLAPVTDPSDAEAHEAQARRLAAALDPELELLDAADDGLDGLHYALGLLWCGTDRYVSLGR